MTDVQIKPLRSYQDGGQIRTARSPAYVVPLRHAKQLEARGLCSILELEEEAPKPGAGAPSSASPADQASPQTTASGSGSGATRGRKKKAAE
ncbi:hypothetical protein [Ectopseudomonas guguanensis]|uniref:hypothetical protein n=1 Tax=Ectopseudomonas guguanensis TaxID=1198456 RepID=UPI0028AEC6D5|nr:hypothetical protein [Pseudomonas guguanensis]